MKRKIGKKNQGNGRKKIEKYCGGKKCVKLWRIILNKDHNRY